MTEPSEDIEQARRNILAQQAWQAQQATRHALTLITHGRLLRGILWALLVGFVWLVVLTVTK